MLGRDGCVTAAAAGCSKRSRRKAARDAGVPTEGGSEAYSGYAATSARARQRLTRCRSVGSGESCRAFFSSLLKSPLRCRLLKKAQMQGGARRAE